MFKQCLKESELEKVCKKMNVMEKKRYNEKIKFQKLVLIAPKSDILQQICLKVYANIISRYRSVHLWVERQFASILNSTKHLIIS